MRLRGIVILRATFWRDSYISQQTSKMMCEAATSRSPFSDISNKENALTREIKAKPSQAVSLDQVSVRQASPISGILPSTSYCYSSS